MIFIGFLLVVAVAVFVGVVLSDNWGGATYTVNGFGHVLGHLNLAEIFLSGVALTAIFFVGLWFVATSSRLRRRASRSRRAETRAGREERDELIAERDRLNRELEAERANRVTAAPMAAAPVVQAAPQVVTLPGDRGIMSGDSGAGEAYGNRLIDAQNADPLYGDRLADESRRHTV